MGHQEYLQATLRARNEKIQKPEEGTLIFLFYQDLVEGVIERSGTLNLRNCFELYKGKSSFGKIPDPSFLISKEFCGGQFFTFEGLIFLTNVFLFRALGVPPLPPTSLTPDDLMFGWFLTLGPAAAAVGPTLSSKEYISWRPGALSAPLSAPLSVPSLLLAGCGLRAWCLRHSAANRVLLSTSSIKLVSSSNDEFKGTLYLCPTLSSCLLYTSPSPRDGLLSRMPSSA